MVYFILIAKLFSTVLGLFFLITRLFLFEQTQGLIQSKIENLWIQIDDYQQSALAKHTAFMQTISGMMSNALDRVFGLRLVSLQSLTVSVCYAFATGFIVLLLLLRYSTHSWDLTQLEFIAIYLSVGTLPAFISYLGRAKKKKFLLIWLTASITFADAMIAIPAFQLWKQAYESKMAWFATVLLLIYASVISALILYASFICLIRRSLKAISNSTSLLRTAGISFLNVAPLFGLYGLFKLLSFKLEHSHITPDMDYKNIAVLQSMFAGWSNRIDVFLVLLLIAFILFDVVLFISATGFALLALVMFLHRALWPIISRVLYASQRFEIVSDGKVLIYIGILFMLLGVGKLSWLENIFRFAR
jgi:hypothetical protein